MIKLTSLAILGLLSPTVGAFAPRKSGFIRSKTTTSLNLYGEPRKVQIIPSVLPADFGKLGADCKALEDAGCDRIQFDVMDGNFVPNLTYVIFDLYSICLCARACVIGVRQISHNKYVLWFFFWGLLNFTQFWSRYN